MSTPDSSPELGGDSQGEDHIATNAGTIPTKGGLLDLIFEYPSRNEVKREYAVVAYPATYQGAVEAAIKVFDLDKSPWNLCPGDIWLRRSTSSAHVGKDKIWARFLPEEWSDVIRPGIDKILISNRSLRLMGNAERAPRILQLQSEKQNKPLLVAIPLPRTFEECQQQALEKLIYPLDPWLEKNGKPTIPMLKGFLGSGRVKGDAVHTLLTPGVYRSYIQRAEIPVIYVSW